MTIAELKSLAANKALSIGEARNALDAAAEQLSVAADLLAVAKCPNCDGCGFTVREIGGYDMDGFFASQGEQEQCQWCYEREVFVAKCKGAEKGQE